MVEDEAFTRASVGRSASSVIVGVMSPFCCVRGCECGEEMSERFAREIRERDS